MTQGLLASLRQQCTSPRVGYQSPERKASTELYCTTYCADVIPPFLPYPPPPRLALRADLAPNEPQERLSYPDAVVLVSDPGHAGLVQVLAEDLALGPHVQNLGHDALGEFGVALDGDGLAGDQHALGTADVRDAEGLCAWWVGGDDVSVHLMYFLFFFFFCK